MKTKSITKKKKPDIDVGNKPYVDNYPQLKQWLDKHEAACMWQAPREERPRRAGCDWSPRAYIECWLVGGRPLIIVVYANKMGWEVYTSANSVSISDTLNDAENRLGLPEPKKCAKCRASIDKPHLDANEGEHCDNCKDPG
jgi:hypothetical protein